MAFTWTPFPILKTWFLLSSLLLCYVLGTLDNNLLSDCNAKPSPRHRSYLTGKDEIRDQLFVSTLDGQVTALDISEGGRLLWSHPTGSVGLFTSSMSKLKVNSNGQVFRLVPSLDGNLYRFNGQALERLPMNADSLLKSSFGLADDTLITGGKESRVYGINLATGEIRYSSVMEGSFHPSGDVDNSEDILVVHRVSHIVRAVEPHSGQERWNFSVGEHYLSFREGLVHGCSQSENDLDHSEQSGETLDTEQHTFHVHAKDGFIGAAEGTSFTWSHKFDSPIVHAWHLKNGKLEAINLFQQQNIQFENRDSAACSQTNMPADLYFGVHHEEYYIQHSPSLKAHLQEPLTAPSQALSKLQLPLIEFKPYLLTGPSRTPHVNIGKQTPARIGVVDEDLTTAVALKEDYLDYPYDAGFYLYSNSNIQGVSVDNETVCGKMEDKIIDLDDSDEEETFIIITSLWHWWKEVLFISIATSVLVNLFLTPIFMKRLKRKLLAETSSTLESQISTSKSTSSKAADQQEPPSADSGISSIGLFNGDFAYKSRYLTDFEPVQRLGKGGFGVVFEARNNIDDCHYAVKRISLPNRDEAREKVMREVKALAKLDHPGIVRYFNAWQECPPPGWQEHLDQQWDTSGHPSITAPSSLPTPSVSSKQVSPVHDQPVTNFINPMSPFDWSSTNTETNNDPSEVADESGSYSFERSQHASSFNMNETSFEIVFQKSQLGDEESVDKKMFENSKCRASPANLEGHTFQFAASNAEDSGCADRSRSTENELVDDFKELLSRSQHNRPNKLDLNNLPQVDPYKPLLPARLYLYIQMQLCRKETLKDWLVVNTAREMDNVFDIFLQIVGAVQYVHDCGLMHRDLKPSNIFFSFDGTVKIGDFGLVTALSEEEAHTPGQVNPDANNTGNFVELQKCRNSKHTDQVGTQLYMSPEQMAGQLYSHKVDVYSLGLIFFELLVPFPTQMERMKVIMNLKNHIFPDDFKRNSPDECAFVQKLLSRDPCDRPSVQEIKEHSLFVPYLPPQPVFRRHRTLSHRFSSSGSECDPSSPTPIEDCAVFNTVTASS